MTQTVMKRIRKTSNLAGGRRISFWSPGNTSKSLPWSQRGPDAASRPSDELSVQLEEAYSSKKRKYSPVKPALHHYNDYIREGWTIEILLWEISIRGLAETAHLQMALSFLDIPQQKWRAIIEDSVAVRASLSQSPLLHA